MRKPAIILVSLITAFTSITPVQAFPPVTMANAVKNPDVIDVRYRGHHGGHHNHYSRHHHGHNYGGAILGGLAAGMIFGGMLGYPYGSGYYGSGYYGSGYYGSGYYGRRAFYGPRAYYGPGAYYGRGAYYGGNGHASSCYARYRSYRAWDNTYQPYYGPRRPCW